jgi:hypothetical protein
MADISRLLQHLSPDPDSVIRPRPLCRGHADSADVDARSAKRPRALGVAMTSDSAPPYGPRRQFSPPTCPPFCPALSA